jgi:hypothetical protein
MRDLGTPLAESFFHSKSVKKSARKSARKHRKVLRKERKAFNKELKESEDDSLSKSTIYSDTYKEKK